MTMVVGSSGVRGVRERQRARVTDCDCDRDGGRDGGE